MVSGSEIVPLREIVCRVTFEKLWNSCFRNNVYVVVCYFVIERRVAQRACVKPCGKFEQSATETLRASFGRLAVAKQWVTGNASSCSGASKAEGLSWPTRSDLKYLSNPEMYRKFLSLENNQCWCYWLSYRSVQAIVMSELIIRVCQICSRLLTTAARASRRCLSRFPSDGPSFTSKMISSYERWGYRYNPETKQQLSQ